jgi:hypothetical protein
MAVHGDVIDFPSYGRIVLGALFAHGANSSIFHVANHPTLVVKAHHFRTRINGELDVSFSSETVSRTMAAIKVNSPYYSLF